MPDALKRVERLQALRDLALLDESQVRVYDELTSLASKTIGAPVSLLSMVAADYQFFKSQVGLPEPWRSRRRTPLSHSFCQHVVKSQAPLVVADAREIPELKKNLAIRDLDVIGYLGIPLTMSDGQTLGSFCVIDSQPREWQDVEIDIINELAQLALKEFEARSQVRSGGEAAKSNLQELQVNILDLITKLDPELPNDKFLQSLKDLRAEYKI